MKKIGFFLGDIHGNGGISRVTWIIANQLNKDFNVYVLSSYHNQESKYKYSDDIQIEFLFNDQKSVHKRFLKITNGIRKFVKDNTLDILICAGAIYYPPCVLAVKGTKTKLICWEHSNVSVSNEHRFQSLCRKIGAKNADMVVPLTKTDEKLYKEKYGIKNCHAIYNPVDEKLIGPACYDVESKKIISVGRLCYQKNFELLVDVAAIFLKKYPDWCWDIFGEGENRSAIQAKIDKVGLQDRLILRGRVTDLYDRYKEYSMLVMTSRFEGFPMTLLESTAKGIPAISFDILTGPNEIIIDGETGYLVESNNVEEMACKIEQLSVNKALREKMSAKCLEIRDNFRCSTIVKAWKELLSNL